MKPEWMTVEIELPNPVEDSPDFEKSMTLFVSVLPGVAPITRGGPDDWVPGSGPEFQIEEAFYEDGKPVPDEVVKELDNEYIYEKITEQLQGDE